MSEYRRPDSRRRRRRPRKDTMGRTLMICAAIVFGIGFAFGFGAGRLTAPEPTIPTIQTEPSETTLPAETEPPATEIPLQERFSADDWNLTLVNPWYAINDVQDIELKSLDSGLMVDQRCYNDLVLMLEACYDAGGSAVVCSAYRSIEAQEELYNNKVQEYLNEGYSQEEAEEEAATVVSVPGTSEHHLGLAVDIVDASYQLLDSAQEDTAAQKWLMEHSWEYGFILRYPSDKSGITGIIYEPWHYRYVGREAAAEIHARGICLEEFLKLLEE